MSTEMLGDEGDSGEQAMSHNNSHRNSDMTVQLIA